jgi:hypothetical protein
MAQLGVFLIPPAEHPFYTLCSGILGYDIWTGRRTTSTLAAHLDLERVSQWLGPAARVGSHCTLSGVALTYDASDLNEVRERLAWIASRTPPFSLVNGRFLEGERARPWALLAELDSPDGAIHRLHRQVATIVNPLRIGSMWASSIPGLPDRPREIYALTGEPWTLELFVPHWTLFTALPDGETRAAVRDLISDRLGLFADERTRTMEITDVHLVERSEDGFCAVIGSFPLTGSV